MYINFKRDEKLFKKVFVLCVPSCVICHICLFPYSLSSQYLHLHLNTPHVFFAPVARPVKEEGVC